MVTNEITNEKQGLTIMEESRYSNQLLVDLSLCGYIVCNQISETFVLWFEIGSYNKMIFIMAYMQAPVELN